MPHISIKEPLHSLTQKGRSPIGVKGEAINLQMCQTIVPLIGEMIFCRVPTATSPLLGIRPKEVTRVEGTCQINRLFMSAPRRVVVETRDTRVKKGVEQGTDIPVRACLREFRNMWTRDAWSYNTVSKGLS